MPSKPRFAICIKNDGYIASLEIQKLYPVVPDKKIEALGMVRVFDESGEDHVYPADLFIAAGLPQRVEKAVAAAS